MRYICPKCGDTIQLSTTYTGWELETVDPDTGEPDEVVEAERTDIHDAEYSCSNGLCDWRANEWYFDDLGEEDGE